MNILIEPHYLPCIRYMSKFLLAGAMIMDDISAFEKQSYRNRAAIAGANGKLVISIPVHDSRARQPIKDVKIDNHATWQKQHWQSIRSAYGRAAYFEYYDYKLRPFFEKEYEYLFDFEIELLQALISMLKMDKTKLKLWSEAEDMAFEDMSNTIHPKAKHDKPDIAFHPIRYPQAFEEKHGFMENLSVLDLLFNMGPDAERVLLESKM